MASYRTNRQPYNRSAHPPGVQSAGARLGGGLAADATLGGNVYASPTLTASLETGASMGTRTYERSPRAIALNRQPFNRSALLRSYPDGKLRMRGTLEAQARPGADVGTAHEIAARLHGHATPGLLVLERRPMAWAPNRQPFNRSARRSGYAAATHHLATVLKSSARPSADAYTVDRLGAGLHGTGKLARGLEIPLPLELRLLSEVDAITGVNGGGELRTVLTGTGILGADVYAARWMQAGLTAFAHLGSDVYFAGGPAILLGGSANLGGDVYEAQALYQVLLGFAGARNIDELITRITGAIPPGSTLVIDADNYAATLDNADVIHWHEGAWLDVGRGTLSFTLSGVGSDEYQWEVFYTARYL